MADVGAQGCSNLWIADGLNPISWSGVFENFENGYPVDCSCVPEKAETEHESDEELEMVWSTPEDTVYGTAKQPAPPRKKGGCTPKGDTSKTSQPQSKGKGHKKAELVADADPEAVTSSVETPTSKKAKIGSQAWKDLFHVMSCTSSLSVTHTDLPCYTMSRTLSCPAAPCHKSPICLAT